jgi:hypothetical protein
MVLVELNCALMNRERQWHIIYICIHRKQG